MFNFFSEIKRNVNKTINAEIFNLINVSGQILYLEGHKGLLSLSKDIISVKVKDAVLIIEGEDMILSELSENTVKICGKIKKVEQV